MGVALNSGIGTCGFAPTSLFGIVTVTMACQAQYLFYSLTLLTAALIANLALLFCRRMDVPGTEHRHRPSKLCNRAGSKELHLHDSPRIKS